MDPRPGECLGFLRQRLAFLMDLGWGALRPSPQNSCPEPSFCICKVDVRAFVPLASRGVPVHQMSGAT